ncbi:MAG: GNAT family N-acetyltransferase [Dehalococcoidia bacterium]|nr:GNAT family N-acetyltransferase [Dehalococcoidia bacterium]
MRNPFGSYLEVAVVRYGTGDSYRMRSLDISCSVSDADIADIVSICNESLVWRFLFRDRLGGRSYRQEDARSFVEWARKGWESGEHMVFFLRDQEKHIGACIDIGGLAESGEALIGYWAGVHHGGVMTNAVESLSQLAAEAGYLKLVALVEGENVRSSAVLRRAGFSLSGWQEQPVTFLDSPVGLTVRFLRYERTL